MEDTKNVTPEEAKASATESSAPEKANSGKQKNKNKNKNKGGQSETHSSSSAQTATEMSNQSQYFGSDAMLALSANWSYANRLGDQIPSYRSANFIDAINGATGTNVEIDDTFGQNTVPGICAIGIVPTPGLNEYAGSSLNVASYQQYGFLRSQISGQRPYTRHDMIMEWQAVDSCYMLAMSCDRAIAAINTLDQQNKYLARNLVEAMGYDYEDLVANLANYISYFNVLKARLNRLTIPAVFPIVKRHAYMMSNVYLDTEISKSQIYVFRLAAVYKYRASDNTLRLTRLTTSTSAPYQTMYMSAWLRQLRDMLDAIFSDSKYAQISGDIEKAYGVENCLSIGITVPNTALQVIYDPEMLYEIHHARFVGNIFEELTTNDLNTWNIKVNMDTPSVFVEWNPIIASKRSSAPIGGVDYVRRAGNLAIDIFLDSASAIPTPHENAVNTRLAFIGGSFTDDPSTDQGQMGFNCVGTEVALYAAYYTCNQGVDIVRLVKDNLIVTQSGSTVPTEADMLKLTTVLPFKKGPMYWHVGITHNSGNVTNFSPARLPLGEIRNYTVIGSDELYRLNNVIIQAMYAIPEAANYKLA